MSKLKNIISCLFAGMVASTESVYGTSVYREKKGNTLADGKPKKAQTRQKFEFRLKGHTIMAYSKKDAIKRLKAQGKI